MLIYYYIRHSIYLKSGTQCVVICQVCKVKHIIIEICVMMMNSPLYMMR